MKFAFVFAFVVAASVAAQQWNEGQAGNTYLINPQTDNVVSQLNWGGRQVRSLPSGRIVRVLSRGLPTERVYRQLVNEQRVLRTPISKTMTILPNEVTRVERNIQTHMPMVHDRLRHYYTVEDENNQKLIHHFVEPVEEKYLGTRKGRSQVLQTQHKLYRNQVFNPATYVDAPAGELIEGGAFPEKFWRVDAESTCAGMAGKVIRPIASCSTGDNDDCNELAYPDNIQC